MGIPYLSEDGMHVYAEGTPVVITESEAGGIIVTWADGSLEVPAGTISIWGGSYTEGSDPVDYDRTSIVVNSGTLRNVWGGNRGPGHIKSVNVIINGGTLYGVNAGVGYGASAVPTWKSADAGETIIDETNVTINGGEMTIVYGGTGSGIATVKETNLVVNGGTMNWCIAGNSNGVCKKATAKITGGTVTSLTAGGNRGTTDDIEMEITGGTHNYFAVLGDSTGEFVGEAEVGLYGGTIEHFQVVNGEDVADSDMTGMSISYADGVINEEDIAGASVEIKKDNTKGQGAKTKTIRIYPFPHKQNNIFGVLIEGLPIDKPAELPMTEQEIRMCLGMGHLFEVVDGKLVVLDIHNYNQDNSDAPEFAGDLPCDDCELVYPREEESDEEEKEEVATQAMRKTRKSTKKVAAKVVPEVEEATVTKTETKNDSEEKVETVVE